MRRKPRKMSKKSALAAKMKKRVAAVNEPAAPAANEAQAWTAKFTDPLEELDGYLKRRSGELQEKLDLICPEPPILLGENGLGMTKEQIQSVRLKMPSLYHNLLFELAMVRMELARLKKSNGWKMFNTEIALAK